MRDGVSWGVRRGVKTGAGADSARVQCSVCFAGSACSEKCGSVRQLEETRHLKNLTISARYVIIFDIISATVFKVSLLTLGQKLVKFHWLSSDHRVTENSVKFSVLKAGKKNGFSVFFRRFFSVFFPEVFGKKPEKTDLFFLHVWP